MDLPLGRSPYCWLAFITPKYTIISFKVFLAQELPIGDVCTSEVRPHQENKEVDSMTQFCWTLGFCPTPPLPLYQGGNGYGDCQPGGQDAIMLAFEPCFYQKTCRTLCKAPNIYLEALDIDIDIISPLWQAKPCILNHTGHNKALSHNTPSLTV